jgi:hypothetical protein
MGYPIFRDGIARGYPIRNLVARIETHNEVDPRNVASIFAYRARAVGLRLVPTVTLLCYRKRAAESTNTGF